MHVITADQLAPSQQAELKAYPSWERFRSDYRNTGADLLKDLPRYRDAVLVAGCQRSGTTMLTRLFASSKAATAFQLTHDDELDAALVLAGLVPLPVDRRYFFQTTYLNENYREYGTMRGDQRLIWLVRTPYAVIRSMVSNWKRFALKELYEFCGTSPADPLERARRVRFPWPIGLSMFEQACFAYAGKASQLDAVADLIGTEKLLVVDYDQITQSPESWIPELARFAGVTAELLDTSAIRARDASENYGFSDKQIELIERVAMPVYRRSIAHIRSGSCAVLPGA